MTEDRGQRPLSDVGGPLSSVPGNLLIPFAVHTAKFGYDWSCVPEGLTRDELDACYRAAVARRPAVLEIGQVVTGVLACGRLKFAFSLQIAKDWDANGRNAEYGAFAFLPSFADLERTDFSELLGRREFRVPDRQPPDSVPWRPPAAAPSVPPSFRAPENQASAVRAEEPAVQRRQTDWTSVSIWAVSIAVTIAAIVAACRG